MHEALLFIRFVSFALCLEVSHITSQSFGDDLSNTFGVSIYVISEWSSMNLCQTAKLIFIAVIQFQVKFEKSIKRTTYKGY